MVTFILAVLDRRRRSRERRSALQQREDFLRHWFAIHPVRAGIKVGRITADKITAPPTDKLRIE